MDASVNMKMTPDEHRLIRSAVETNAEVLRNGIQNGQYEGKFAREAREREAQLRALLIKL